MSADPLSPAARLAVPACGGPGKDHPCRMKCKVATLYIDDRGMFDDRYLRRWPLSGCGSHLSDVDRALLEAIELYEGLADNVGRQLREARVTALLEPCHHRPQDQDPPVCWSWFREDRGPRPTDLASLERWQRGACAACGSVEALSIDHDHWCGMVRGFLCWTCNGGTGSPGGPAQDGPLGCYRQRHPAGHFGLKIPYTSGMAVR